MLNNEANTFFNWRLGSDSLAVKAAQFKSNRSGNYTAQAYRIYSPDLTCYSAFSSSIQFVAVVDNEGLSIYPNPSADKKITIETLTDIQNATVHIFTLLGQHVREFTVADFNERRAFDLSDLRSGLYIIQVRASGFNVAKRVFIGF